MRIATILLVVLFPSLVSAQTITAADCLSDQRVDNQVSGKVVYVRFKHPARDVFIEGYKIVLRQPRCYERESISNPGRATVEVSEVQLLPWSSVTSPDLENKFFKSDGYPARWKELNAFLRPKIGSMVTVKGEMQTIATAYYVAVPQIVVGSLALCEDAPKSKNIAKC